MVKKKVTYMKHELNLIDNQLLSLAKFRIKGFGFNSNVTDEDYKALVEKLRVQHNIVCFPNSNIYKELSRKIIDIIRLEKGEKTSTLDMVFLNEAIHNKLESHLTEDFYYALFVDLLGKLSVIGIKNIDFQPVNEI